MTARSTRRASFRRDRELFIACCRSRFEWRYDFRNTRLSGPDYQARRPEIIRRDFRNSQSGTPLKESPTEPHLSNTQPVHTEKINTNAAHHVCHVDLTTV